MENGAGLSKEELVEVVDEVSKVDIHDVILPIPGDKESFLDTKSSSGRSTDLLMASIHKTL